MVCSMRGIIRLTWRVAPSLRFSARFSPQPWYTRWDVMFGKCLVESESTCRLKVTFTNATLPSVNGGARTTLRAHAPRSGRTPCAQAWSGRQSATAFSFLSLNTRAKLSRGNGVGSPGAPLTTTVSADRCMAHSLHARPNRSWTCCLIGPRLLLAPAP